MKFISKLSLIRLGLLAASVAVIMVLLPHPDHQSLQYDLGQPWKYPLLTAPFDMPLMRDSVTVKELRDSVDRNFIPFVKRSDDVAEAAVTRFRNAMADSIPPAALNILSASLQQVFADGIVDSEIAPVLGRPGPKTLRVVDNGLPDNTVTGIDASVMRTPAKAFEYIDSAYRLATAKLPALELKPSTAQALNICLIPNIRIDSVSDSKYRNQEYLNATGAQGVIKQGQRIVDRGEIITPQIFTNLHTYEQMLTERQMEGGDNTYFSIGQILYTLAILGVLYLFMAIYRPRFFADSRKMCFLLTFITFIVALTIVMFENVNNGIWLVPFAAVPVVILVFFDSRTAIFSLGVTVFLSAMVATYPYQFIIIELTVGMLASFSLKQLTSRSQLLRVAAIAFASYCVMYFITQLMLDGDLTTFTWRHIGLFAINSVILSFAYILIVVIEKLFGFTSTVTLVELSDINSPLLRKLAEDAPGTFQHSMQVSTLAAEAARAVGANIQLVRTGALYHDIGKMESPVFFTENQHGINPHAGLEPRVSAQKIISHVTAGLQMASKAKLPAVIRDFIAEHHGKGITKYFYNQEANAHPGEYIDPTPFRYPGPNPRSRETTVLMMADAVEAASRSLKDHSPQSIDRLVDKIIDGQMADGLYNDSPITFHDVQVIKKTFKKRLATIYHSRVEYPELHSDTATARQAPEKPVAPVAAASNPAPEPNPVPEPAQAHMPGADATSLAMLREELAREKAEPGSKPKLLQND